MVVGALDALRQIPLPGDARALLDTLLFNLLKEVTTTCLHGIPITSATYVRPRNFFLRLACQSGLWAKAQGGGDLGTWSFNIATYGTPQIGQGIYDSSSSTFSGTTWYNTTGGGRNGQVSCSNSPYCVYYYTADGGGACTYAWCGAGIGCDHVCYFRATVKNLPVYGAVKID